MGEKIFQVCLAKTNDTGEALYTELDLPARPWALLDALDKVRYREGNDLSLEIDTYYDCEELEPHLTADQISLMELNDLAARISDMSDTQRIAFQGLLRMDEAKEERLISLQRLRDLAESADCCHVVHEARSPSQLGRFYAENGFVPEIESLPDSVFELLDFELIGHRAQQGEGGVFTDYGYVVQNSDLNIAPELTNKVPQPPKYTVLLELLRRAAAVSKGLDGDSESAQFALSDSIRVEMPGLQSSGIGRYHREFLRLCRGGGLGCRAFQDRSTGCETI